MAKNSFFYGGASSVNPDTVSEFLVLAQDSVDAAAASAAAAAASATTAESAAAAGIASHTSNTSNPHAVTKTQVGLGSVDNTSDINKPVSTAQQAALDAVATTAAGNLAAHTGNTTNPHAVTKTQVGLSNVDNTSDANKPISTATQTALNLKAPLDSPAFTGTPTVPTAVAGTSTIQASSTAFVQQELTSQAVKLTGAQTVAGVKTFSSGVNTPSINGGPLAGTRNRIINGNFAINQRGVSGTVTLAAGAYGHDRWKAGASGCTYTFAASGNDTVITITSGSLMQVVEGVNVEGGQYTLNNGGGTAQMRVAINGAATSGAYASGPLTTSSATANQSITVEFTTGTVGKVQLEPGTTASTFERRLYGMELALCQRYYEKGNVALRTNGTGSGGNGTFISFAEPKRTTPTIVYSSTTYTYGCSGISSNPFANGFECFVSATGACAFASVWETSGAEL
jgi:hypothetical protein